MSTMTKQKFQVFANVTMPISVEVEGNNINEAQAIAQYQLYELNVAQVNLTIVKDNGEVISPKVHDWNIDVQTVFKD